MSGEHIEISPLIFKKGLLLKAELSHYQSILFYTAFLDLDAASRAKTFPFTNYLPRFQKLFWLMLENSSPVLKYPNYHKPAEFRIFLS